MDNKNNTKKKVIITILALILVAVGILFALKGCQKEEPVVHTHSYKINEEGTWICKEDNDILSNTDKPYVAILENNEPKDILAIDSLSKSKINLGNGTIYKDGNNIYYSGNNAQTIIIKTQKVDDKQKDKDNLVINAPNDTVYHYGSSTVISLDAVATNSFHEYGKVDLITLTKARVVLETPSNVKEIYLDINDANYSYETTIIALKEEVELPRLTRDAVNLEEGEVKTLAIVQKLKDEVKTETNTKTNEVIETILEVQTAKDDYVKIENVRKSNDELIIEAFLSPNADETDKTQTQTQSTSTITLEEAKEGSSHPASHNTFVPKEEKVIEVVKPTETKEEQKQEETKPVVTPTKKEETKPEVTPTEEDTPSKPNHSHSYGNWYDLDDTYHAKKCSCGDVVKEAHVSDANGVCQKCGHNAVAKIGNVYYKTLEAAVKAASDNSTIVILENITVDNSNVIDKNITLELNGKKIVAGNTWNGASPTAQGVFYVKSGAKFTINDSIGDGEISTENSNVYGAIVLTIGGDASNNDSSEIAELVVNGGTLKGYYYGVVTNGNRHNTKITINGGTLTGHDSANATSIYHPNKGELIINGGTLKGYDGLAIKGGNVNITGGTFIANGNWNEAEAAQSSGSNSVGAALYVEGNYGYDAKINVSGGEFIANGTDGKAVYVGFNEDPKANVNITGGVYNSNPSKYVATFGCKINNQDPVNGQWETIEAIDGKWTVTANPEIDAEISVSKQGEKTLYGTLGSFRDDVNNGISYAGYTATLLKDIDLNNEEWTPIGTSEHPFNGVFDGQGYTIKNLVIDSDTGYAGLFGNVTGTATDAPHTANAVWNSDSNTVIENSYSEDKYSAGVKNLIIDGFEITNTDGDYVGAVVAYGKDAYFANITVKNGSVSGNGKTGGVIGATGENVVLDYLSTESSVAVSSSGHSVGGIIGGVNRGGSTPHLAVIVNCTNRANVSGTDTSNGIAAGILGHGGSTKGLNVAVINCANYGEVKCQTRTAGIVANAQKVKLILNCVNYGKVWNEVTSGNNFLGGIAGECDTNGLQIVACINNGQVTGFAGNGKIAGIIGSIQNANLIEGCVNRGTITNTKANGTYDDITAGAANVLVADNATYTVDSSVSGAMTKVTIIGGETTCTSIVIDNENIEKVFVAIENFNGTITGLAGKTLCISGANSTVTIPQNSSIDKVVVSGANCTIINNGTIGTIRFEVAGNNSIENNGTIANTTDFAFTISSTTNGANVTITNNGTIEASDSEGAYALYFGSGATCVLNNQGTITGYYFGKVTVSE